MTNPAMQTRQIITRFGGVAALAKRLGHRNSSTVQGWWERNQVPSPRIPELCDLAPFDLEPNDFFAGHEAAQSPNEAAG